MSRSLSLFTRPGAAELAFCYVDSGFETSGPFAAHLRRYLERFAELSSVEFVYVATASTRLGQAETVSERLLWRGRMWLTNVVDPDRLLAHFRALQLFEKRESSGFDRLRIDALRDGMDCFSTRHFAQMFARWKTSGDEVIRAEIGIQKMPNGRYSSCILSHDYDLLGLIVATS